MLGSNWWWLALLAMMGLGVWVWGERGALLRLSTWRMVRLSGVRRLLNLNTLHGYVYARWTDAYMALGMRLAPHLGARGKRWLADHYHSVVLPTDLAVALVTVCEDIPLRDLEQIVPYATARDLVLSASPDLAVLECPCRGQRANPCSPTQVCMVVGQPFVDFMVEHHPDTCRRLTQDEAVALLAAEHRRGHVHSAWFKESSAGRFYAICNCCPCCCGGIEAMNRMAIPMMRSSGYVAEVDAARCTACGACVRACPFAALEQQAHATPRLHWERCLGCGVCVGRCPCGALSLLRDARKGPPLDVRQWTTTGLPREGHCTSGAALAAGGMSQGQGAVSAGEEG